MKPAWIGIVSLSMQTLLADIKQCGQILGFFLKVRGFVLPLSIFFLSEEFKKANYIFGILEPLCQYLYECANFLTNWADFGIFKISIISNWGDTFPIII